jgi:uncharacterized protein (DUF1810 family)
MAYLYQLDRFKLAQDHEFQSAVRELGAGRKRGHWVWYIFPQLRGLGHSPMSDYYGLDGIGEAEAYLRDPLLRSRLLEATRAVHEQIVGRQARVEDLMGSPIDAMKLVSSLTLFERAARCRDVLDDTQLDDLGAMAAAILDRASTQGFPPCAFTLQGVQKRRR